jgi:hypothetical protein
MFKMTMKIRYQLSNFENSPKEGISSTDPHFGDSVSIYVVDACAKLQDRRLKRTARKKSNSDHSFTQVCQLCNLTFFYCALLAAAGIAHMS